MSVFNFRSSMIIVSALFLSVLFQVRYVNTAVWGFGETQALYTSSDEVIVLNGTNFKHKVLYSKQAWLIEFYSSWCGHCIKFAPHYKKVAADVSAWKSVLLVGAIDCAVEANAGICREYEVMAYPSLKLFEPDVKDGDLGRKYDGYREVTLISQYLAGFLHDLQVKGKGTNWPDLMEQTKGKLSDLWQNLPSNVTTRAIFVEGPSSFLGQQLILDMIPYKFVSLRRVTRRNQALLKLLNPQDFPSLFISRNGGEFQEAHPRSHNREGFHAALLGKDEVTISEIGAGDGSAPRASKVTIDDKVYWVDLENAVQYSLRHEVSLHKVITGEPLGALRDYIHILVKYFSGLSPISKFFSALNDYLHTKEDAIKGEEFISYMDGIENPSRHLPRLHPWQGCAGSTAKYRGYPCSLWTLFHYLTVNSVLYHQHEADFHSQEVLKTMSGYIKNFFGCEHCAQHFMKRVNATLYKTVQKPDDSILWLWEAHNTANYHLSGDLSEDPEHPKIQFPSSESCSTCRDPDGNFDRKEVLTFLKQMYDRKNVRDSGSQPNEKIQNLDKKIIDHPSSHQKSKHDSFISNSYRKGSRSFPLARTYDHIFVEKQKVSGWSFSSVDISLCVALYILSGILLVVLYFMFIVRRRYRRKYYQDKTKHFMRV